MIAILISIWASVFPIRKSTKSIYFAGFNSSVGSLTAEIYSYYAQEKSEAMCQHYLNLISKPKNNHICNKIKQDEVSRYCTEIRRLLPKLSSKRTANKGDILKTIYTQLSYIEVNIDDFCYK